MFNNEKSTKLIKLTSRAVSINKELLNEEKKLIQALENNAEVTFLERLTDRIKLLIRKENLYTSAVKTMLQKFTS